MICPVELSKVNVTLSCAELNRSPTALFLITGQGVYRTNRLGPDHIVKHPPAAGAIVELDHPCKLPGLLIFHQVNRPAVDVGPLGFIAGRSIPATDHIAGTDIILGRRLDGLIAGLNRSLVFSRWSQWERWRGGGVTSKIGTHQAEENCCKFK